MTNQLRAASKRINSSVPRDDLTKCIRKKNRVPLLFHIVVLSVAKDLYRGLWLMMRT